MIFPSLNSSLPLYPLNSTPFLSLKNKTREKNTHLQKQKPEYISKNLEKQKMPKQSNMSQHVYKNTVEFVLSYSSTTGCGAYSEGLLIYPVMLHYRKLIFSLQVVVSCR